jgi:DNA replication protein DnaC
MIKQNITDGLKKLKLLGMLEALESLYNQPESSSLSFEERLEILLDRELLSKDNKRYKRLLNQAKFRILQASTEEIFFNQDRKLDRSMFTTFASCNWIRAQQNIIFIGATGVGKSYLACALGKQACRQGMSVKYFRVPRLFEELRIAQASGNYNKYIANLSKLELLILDDWGLGILATQERHDLLEILEDRYGLKSTIVTSQLPIKSWHEYVGDATIADAILDRILSNAHKVEIFGHSLREKNNV